MDSRVAWQIQALIDGLDSSGKHVSAEGGQDGSGQRPSGNGQLIGSQTSILTSSLN